MAMLSLSINREDPDYVLVQCEIGGAKITDEFFCGQSKTDAEIEEDVRAKLANIGYEFN